MKKIFLIIVISFFVCTGVKAQVSVIVNKSVNENNISASQLGNIYSLTITKWKNGSRITVFDYNSENSTQKAFYGYIDRNSLALKKEWMTKQLTGEANAPTVLGSDEEILSKVASTPGAIGYVKSSIVNNSVKVIAEIK